MTDVASVPHFLVSLDDPPATRWREIAKLYGTKLDIPIEDHIVDFMKQRLGPGFAPIVESVCQSIMSMSTQLGIMSYCEELKGISEAANVPLGKLVMLQLVYESCAMCTSVISPLSASGNPMLARTMDWAMPFLGPLTAQVTFTKGGAPVAIATTWIGYVGVLTGMSYGSSPVGISVNARLFPSSELWGTFRAALNRSWPIGFLVREVLTSSPTFESAVDRLRSSPVVVRCYFIVCGGKPGEGIIITRDRYGDVNPLSLKEQPFLVQPNMDHWSDNPKDSVMLSLKRRDVSRMRVTHLLDHNALTVQNVWDAVLSAPALCHEATIYGTVMIPSTGFYETRVPRKEKGFIPISLSEAEALPGYSWCSRCGQTFDAELNVPGQCSHTGEWHESPEQCSYVKCTVGLGWSNAGMSHWSCCFSTKRDSLCKKSPAHLVDKCSNVVKEIVFFREGRVEQNVV